MKKATAFGILVYIALIVAGIAAPPTAITNYYTGAVITTNTFADAGDTGLITTNSYICIPLNILTNGEYTSSLVTNDVRPMISAIIKHLDESIDAQASSNRFTTFIVSEDVRYPSATNRIVFRAISEQQTITITPGYPTE